MSTARTAPRRAAAVELALRAATAAHGMRACAFVVLSAESAVYEMVVGGWGTLTDGFTLPRGDSIASRTLDGARASTAATATDGSYKDTAEVTSLGVMSSIALPVMAADGTVLGVLIGLDPGTVDASAAVALLRGLADGLATTLADGTTLADAPDGAGNRTGDGRAHRQSSGPGTDRIVVRRARTGWIVDSPNGEIRPVGDLTSAMVLADLLADDLAPPGRPRRPDMDLGEIERLRVSVVQLEHALASRVIVEQAIGVLAERHGIRPREAFERLRRTARGLGRRVHDLARQVVDSVGDPRVPLPGELAARSAGPARPAPPRSTPPRSTPTRR